MLPDTMSYSPNSPSARDVSFALHPYTNPRLHEAEGPIIIERGEGDLRLGR